MRILYNIFIHIYICFLWISSFRSQKNKHIFNGQKGLMKRIVEATGNMGEIVWVHLSSLGEFEQGKPILLSYKKKYPSHKILITVYSPSAYKIVKNKGIAEWVFYLPHDTAYNAKKFVAKIKPVKAIFIKYDFWYNYISELYNNSIPTYYVCSIFRKDQYFFSFYGKWFTKQLQKITRFYIQDIDSKCLLNSVGIKNIIVTGDTRFDSVKMNKAKPYNNRKIEDFIQSHKTIMLGSIWKSDKHIIQSCLEYTNNYKLIIVPHEINQIKYLRNMKDAILLSDIHSHEIRKYNI